MTEKFNIPFVSNSGEMENKLTLLYNHLDVILKNNDLADYDEFSASVIQ